VAAGEAGHVWTPEEIALFIENPNELMPGTRMTFAGLRKPEERADVIAHIESAGGGG
jgi:cytochrome c